MKRVVFALICTFSLSGCTPLTLPMIASMGTDIVGVLYVGFWTTRPQGIDELYSEEWPSLVQALKRHYPDEYWAALGEIGKTFRASEALSNPLMLKFGHHAAFASDDAHRRVLEVYIAVLLKGMEQDEDFCLSEEPAEHGLALFHQALVDAVAEGINAPVERPEATTIGQQVVIEYVKKRGIDPIDLQSLLAGQLYSGACGDVIILLRALNYMDTSDAKVWRANIVAFWTGLL